MNRQSGHDTAVPGGANGACGSGFSISQIRPLTDRADHQVAKSIEQGYHSTRDSRPRREGLTEHEETRHSEA